MRYLLPLLLLIGTSAFLRGSHQPGPVPPISALPYYLPFELGSLSVVADYGEGNRERRGGITAVYLVNASDASIQCEPATLTLVKEARQADGTWGRCYWMPKATMHNWFVSEVPPWSALPVFFGPLFVDDPSNQPDATLQTVRYVFYGDARALISQEGSARVGSDEVQTSRFDRMGLRTGPIEDLAAVAKGDVRLSHKDEGIKLYAIDRLDPLAAEPAVIEVLKQVLKNANRDNDMSAYIAALRALAKPRDLHWSIEDFWSFATDSLERETSWAPLMLRALLDSTAPSERKLALLETIVADPKHPLLAAAAERYAEFAGPVRAAKKLTAILKSRTSSPLATAAARYARERLLPFALIRVQLSPNPYVPDKQSLVITIGNAIGTPTWSGYGNPEDLLDLVAFDELGREIKAQKRAVPITPGKEIAVAPDKPVIISVEDWGARFDTKAVPSGTGLTIAVRVKNPDKWQVPTQERRLEARVYVNAAAVDWGRVSQRKLKANGGE